MQTYLCTQQDYDYEIERIRGILQQNGMELDTATTIKFCDKMVGGFKAADSVGKSREDLIRRGQMVMAQIDSWAHVRKCWIFAQQ